MIIPDAELTKQLKAGICNPKELSRYLLNNYPATQLAEALAEELIENTSSKPIVLTREQFETHFRVQGWKFVDGQWQPETRGNFRKKD